MNTGTPLYCDAFDSMQLNELSTYTGKLQCSRARRTVEKCMLFISEMLDNESQDLESLGCSK